MDNKAFSPKVRNANQKKFSASQDIKKKRYRTRSVSLALGDAEQKEPADLTKIITEGQTTSGKERDNETSHEVVRETAVPHQGFYIESIVKLEEAINRGKAMLNEIEKKQSLPISTPQPSASSEDSDSNMPVTQPYRPFIENDQIMERNFDLDASFQSGQMSDVTRDSGVVEDHFMMNVDPEILDLNGRASINGSTLFTVHHLKILAKKLDINEYLLENCIHDSFNQVEAQLTHSGSETSSMEAD